MTCKPLILCDSDTPSLVISSITVLAADSVWEEGGLIEGIIISLRCFDFFPFSFQTVSAVSSTLNRSFYVGLPFRLGRVMFLQYIK